MTFILYRPRRSVYIECLAKRKSRNGNSGTSTETGKGNQQPAVRSWRERDANSVSQTGGFSSEWVCFKFISLDRRGQFAGHGVDKRDNEAGRNVILLAIIRLRRS